MEVFLHQSCLAEAERLIKTNMNNTDLKYIFIPLGFC